MRRDSAKTNQCMALKSKSALGVVILGAGASVRMGRPKLLLPWRGTSVIAHLVAQWRRLEATQIAIVCRREDKLLATELRRIGFPPRHCIVNPNPERGMFSSIVCAAKWKGWDARVTAWVISLGDQPHLQMETLRTVLLFHARHPDAVCQPFFEKHRRHPVLLPRDAFLALRKTHASNLHEYLQRSNFKRMECSIEDSGLSLDLDYPEDYNRLSTEHRAP